MGFLIFAYRKLSLIRQINQKQYRSMCLSTELDRVKEQSDELTKAKANLEDGWRMMSDSIFGAQESYYNSQMASVGDSLQKALTGYNQAKGTAGEATAKAAYEAELAKSQQDKTPLIQQYQAFQSLKAASNNAFKFVLDKSDDVQLELLHQKEKRYEMEVKSLDSSIALLSGELTKVESAESKSAERCAPSFGLS